MAGYRPAAGGAVPLTLQRPVQAAPAPPLLSPGSLRTRGGPLLQPGRQARAARHHRVSTGVHAHTHTQQKYTLGIRSMLLVSAFYVFYFTFLFCEK